MQAVDEPFDDGRARAARDSRSAPERADRESDGLRGDGGAIGGSTYMPDFGSGTAREQLLDDLIRRHVLGLRVEVREHAVAQHRLGQRADVVEAHVVAPVHQRARLAAEDEMLRRARAGAVGDPLLDEVRRLRARPARAREAHRVSRHRLGDRHASHELLERDDVLAGHRVLEAMVLHRRRRRRDLRLRLIFGQVVHDDVEHEPVELRFGQRIRALELDRVLRREDEERLLRACTSCPARVTRCSCIASSSADCVFGGVRLISSASTMFAKIGPGVNTSRRPPVSGSSWMMSVPVMSLGIRSGVNWMRENLRSSTCAIVLIEQRLRQARHADDQAVAAGEQRQQHVLDHFLLTDDELVQLGDDLVVSGFEAVGERDVVGAIRALVPL